MAYTDITPPAGDKITISNGKLTVPDHPVIPFIRGDGTGPDIWAASEKVFDAAVEKAYGGKKKIAWFEVFAGEASKTKFDNWLPDDTITAFKEFLVGIKGPLTTPVGGGIRSLNVALRQMLDLYVCLRPVQYFTGVPSPVKAPEKVEHGHLPREHGRHLRGHRFRGGQRAGAQGARVPEARTTRRNSRRSASAARYAKVRATVGIGIKPVSRPGTERLVRAAIQYAIDQKEKSVTFVHKGNIMKYTEGAFRDWGYAVAKKEFGAVEIDGGPWCKLPNGLIIKDAIADITLQQVLTRPGGFRRHRDAEPERRLSFRRARGAGRRHRHRAGRQHQLPHRPRHLRGDPRHRAQVRRDKDMVNPGSVVLSGEMMFRYLGWTEVADLILKGLNGAIASKKVTYDFARLMEGAEKISCSAFGDNIIAHM